MRPVLTEAEVSKAFHDACLAELDALKPGNVHRLAADERMTVAEFEISARVSAPAIARKDLSIGARIRAAIEATRVAVGHNTNLGIVLLSSPLAAAAFDDAPVDLRGRLARVLAGLTEEDAREAYAAIREARPGGLGSVPDHDVVAEPKIGLREAMRAAEMRDRIAWNYTHDFADLFDFGLPRLEAALARWQSLPAAVSFLYLGFLARQRDSLIERKFGRQAASRVVREAQELESAFAGSAHPSEAEASLLAFDSSLKKRRFNPGTSADLTVATLFAGALIELERRG